MIISNKQFGLQRFMKQLVTCAIYLKALNMEQALKGHCENFEKVQ